VPLKAASKLFADKGLRQPHQVTAQPGEKDCIKWVNNAEGLARGLGGLNTAVHDSVERRKCEAQNVKYLAHAGGSFGRASSLLS
jgi:hypothetical protein